MRILFVGTVKFSYEALKQLIKMNETIVGVITKSQSTFNSDFKDLTPLCKQHNIPIFYSDNINNTETENWIKKKEPELGLCLGWSQIIKDNILQIPQKGFVGFHPAELPKNRGRHPIIWALVLGLEQTASTFFFIDKGVDSGKLISQEIVPISYGDNASTLYDKITAIALNQMQDFIPKLKNGSIKPVPQDETSANSWRKRGRQDGLVDFRMNSYAIYNLVRALTHPYVGAHVIYKGQEIKIWKVEEADCSSKNIEPGAILDVFDNGNILVKTYDKAIKIIEHEFIDTPLKGEYL